MMYMMLNLTLSKAKNTNSGHTSWAPCIDEG